MAEYPSLTEKIDAAINDVTVFRKEPTYVVMSNSAARTQFETQVHYVLAEAGFLPHAEQVHYGYYLHNPSPDRLNFHLSLEFEIDVARGLIAYGTATGTAARLDGGLSGSLLLTDVEVSFQGLQKIRSGKVSYPYGQGLFEGLPADSTEVEISREDLDRFVEAYIESALHASDDEVYRMPHAKSSFAESTLRQMVKGCEVFLSENIADIRRGNNSDNIEEAGAAFWRARNKESLAFHGWPKRAAARLEAASFKFKSVDLRVGNDGKIYQA